MLPAPFSGISFEVQLTGGVSYGWSGLPDVTFTSPTFEVTINPNCAAGQIDDGWWWDSNSLDTLPLETRYLLNLSYADANGIRSTTLFDESFGSSLTLIAGYLHCEVFYNLTLARGVFILLLCKTITAIWI